MTLSQSASSEAPGFDAHRAPPILGMPKRDDIIVMVIIFVISQMCVVSVVDDTFDEEGTCLDCVVHNMVRPHVLGQWYFILYQVSIAPPRMPVKNVIKEMSKDMAKKFFDSGGIGSWTDSASPSVKLMGDILDEIRVEAGITIGDKKIHSIRAGIDRNISPVICLCCGHRVWQVDKECLACDTDNDIVIRFVDGEKWIVHRTIIRSTGKVKFKEIKVLSCPWCQEASELSDQLQCSVCGVCIDVVQEHFNSINKQPDGCMRHEVWHFAFLCPHHKSDQESGVRPEAAVEIVGRAAPAAKSKSPPSTPPTVSGHRSSVSPASPQVVSPRPSVPQQSTALVLRPNQSPIVASAPKKNLSERLFGRTAKKAPSARTIRRHNKAARDAQKIELVQEVQRLVQHKNSYTLDQMSKLLTKKLDRTITINHVRTALKKSRRQS